MAQWLEPIQVGQEAEVDRRLAVSDHHHVVATVVRRFVTRLDMCLNVRGQMS